jgi:Na+-driven multidrug efflux pump
MKGREKNAVAGAIILIIGIFLLVFGHFNILLLTKYVSIFTASKLSEIIDQILTYVLIMGIGVFLLGSGLTALLMSFDVVRRLEEKTEHKTLKSY